MIVRSWRTLLLSALLLLACERAASQDCPGRDLQAYMDCVADHPCQCSSCDPDPTDGQPVIEITRPTNCADIHDIFCPLVQCCAVCEAAALGWYQCSAADFSLFFLEYECQLNCDAAQVTTLQAEECSDEIAADMEEEEPDSAEEEPEAVVEEEPVQEPQPVVADAEPTETDTGSSPSLTLNEQIQAAPTPPRSNFATTSQGTDNSVTSSDDASSSASSLLFLRPTILGIVAATVAALVLG